MDNILHYRDIVSTVAKNMDFFSATDRIAVGNMIEVMLDTYKDLDPEEKDRLKLEIFNEWARYAKTVYNSDILVHNIFKTDIYTRPPMEYVVRFTFSIIWSVNYPKPELIVSNEKLEYIKNLSYPYNIQEFLDSGKVWALNGPVIIVSTIYPDIQREIINYKVYCGDEDNVYIIQRIDRDLNGKMYVSEEIWRKDGKLYRENGPAVIKFNNKGEITSSKWYRDSTEYSSGHTRSYMGYPQEPYPK